MNIVTLLAILNRDVSCVSSGKVSNSFPVYPFSRTSLRVGQQYRGKEVGKLGLYLHLISQTLTPHQMVMKSSGVRVDEVTEREW